MKKYVYLLVLLIACILGSCGTDSDEPNNDSPDNSLIEGCWNATIRDLHNGYHYCVSFTNGFVQFLEIHNGKSSRTNGDYSYDSEKGILTIDAYEGVRNGTFKAMINKDDKFVITLPDKGDVCLSKSEDWYTGPYLFSHWGTENNSISGFLSNTGSDTNQLYKGFILYGDGTGVVLMRGSLNGKDIVYSFHSYKGDDTNGELWYSIKDDPEQEIYTVGVAGLDGVDEGLVIMDGQLYRFYLE